MTLVALYLGKSFVFEVEHMLHLGSQVPTVLNLLLDNPLFLLQPKT